MRQHDAEFGHEATEAVLERGAFFNKALPGAMQSEPVLLGFFLDRDEAPVGTGDGSTEGGGVRRIVLAALSLHYDKARRI